MALGPGFGGVTTPEQVDMLPLSPAAKAAWKAKLVAPPPLVAAVQSTPGDGGLLLPGAPAPVPAPPPTAGLPAPVVPSMMDVVDQSGGLAPKPPASPAPMGGGMLPSAPAPAPSIPLLPPGAADMFLGGGGAPSGPPKPPAGPAASPAPTVPGGGGGGGGIHAPVADNPTGYGLPLPAIDPMAQKKATVLLPGQDAQQQAEQAFLKSQAAKDAEIAGIKVTAQEKVAAEQAGAVEAYAQASAQEAKERADFSAYYDGEMSKLQATSDRLANAKVDSMRVFKQEGIAGVFQAISVAFAMYAGVKGAAATGGQNAGVMAIDKAIERDVAAQEKDLARQEAGLARSNSLLAQKYRIFGDMQMAKAAAKLDAWKIAGMRADVIAQQSGSEAAKVAAGKVAEAADRGIAKAQEDWNIGIEAKWKQYQMQQAQAAAAAASAQQAKMDEERKFWRDKNANVLLKGAEEITKAGGIPKLVPVTKVDPDTGTKYAAYTLVDAKTGMEFTGVPGGGSGAVTVPILQYGADGSKGYTQGTVAKDDAKKVKEANEALAGIKDKVLQLQALRSKHGGGWVTMPGAGLVGTDAAKDRDKAMALHGQIKLEVKKIAELGAPSAKDWELVEDIAGSDPTSYGGTYDAKLNAMGDWATSKHQNIVQSSVKGAAPDAPIQMTPAGGK